MIHMQCTCCSLVLDKCIHIYLKIGKVDIIRFFTEFGDSLLNLGKDDVINSKFIDISSQNVSFSPMVKKRK